MHIGVGGAYRCIESKFSVILLQLLLRSSPALSVFPSLSLLLLPNSTALVTSFAAPGLCDSLPSDTRNSPSLPVFKCHLNSYPFCKAFQFALLCFFFFFNIVIVFWF